ncbi:hypothetical protein FB45DRAFT_98273 [Roridomyces roridus]|uniref:Transcription factor BYE1 n=1 Tax=Roridomyces roridus TaxID=1738132 RepID=A0AAD7BJI6_9AGAR|nr:hypothetical protein FB45DRAFT_98273 [Roridomyces roridus]
MSTKSKAGSKKNPLHSFCICKTPDDGTPMVFCGECQEWFHFSCVNLSEQAAEDINVFICPPCTETTGLRTVMLWEGPEAVQEVISVVAPVPKKKTPQAPLSDSGDDPSSEDEYIGDRKRRRARRLSISSESESDAEASTSKRQSNKTNLKRKAVERAAHPPASKRKKAASATPSAADDPARAFCLGKLGSVFHEIFLRYPHVAGTEKKPEELSEGEKAKVEEQAKQFATDLEQCVYDIYSETDHTGKTLAGSKYKDRFRMLQFNLREKDRVLLHRGIASGSITPKELSLMSPADLANEQLKESIRIAEEEALAHSILEKTVVPRAKLTHKGLEELETIVDDEAVLREREQARRKEEEEKRAREQAARLRTRTASVSLPPESPTIGSASWGAPPPMPVQISTPTDEMSATVAAFVGSPSDALEPEMNLADLINIDDELAVAVGDVSVPPPAAPTKAPSPPVVQSPVTGISPFATKSEAPRASFDLNSLWSAPKKEEEEPVASPPQPQGGSPIPLEESKKEEEMDLDTDDMDFDAFLDEKPEVAPTPEALQATFNAVPQVWTGKINMPLDSTIPQETPVVARQIGGRPLEASSVLWQTLFPSDLLRIDGRVPVDKSAQFLLQTRMNSTKELIAVAFSPASDSSSAGFQILTDFLIAKGRHGLVFPWGTRPKETNPGKELYIIPLLSSDPIPDYMELLDNLRLPAARATNYLVGIWVLNKGKLASPPPAAPAPAPALAPVPVPYAVPPPAAQPLSFEPSVLAAEVAALTPEQVRAMLQSLTASTLNAIPAPSALPPPPLPQLQPPPPPQMWGPMPGYPPPPHMGHPPPPPPSYGQQPPYDRRDYNRDPHPPRGGYDRPRDGGGRDGGRNRGRGRGRGGGAGGSADSGWPRRREDGQGSPGQRRWN